MLFLPELLNQHRLFQHFNGLKKESEAFGDLKESILNHGTDAIVRMERIRSLNRNVLLEFALFEDQLNLQDNKVVFSSMSMCALLNEVSPLLSTIRILQNKTLGLVSVWEGKSLPQSINDFTKKPDRYSISAEVVGLISDYWERSGRIVKFYRDIDQHDFVNSELTSRYFVMHSPEAIAYIELPDFQEITKRTEFTYDNQTNALELLDDACFEVHELIEAISKTYGAEPEPHVASTRLAQLGDLRPFRQRTLAMMFEQKVTKSEAETTLHLSAIRFDQREDGRLEVAKLALDESKLKQANAMYGVKDELDNDKT